MKSFLLLLFFPLQLLAQPPVTTEPDITGSWTGYVQSSQKKLPYEVVITDSSGILTGFSKIIFTINGEEYTAVKSLNIRKEKNKYILEEDKLFFDNLQEDAPKKIRQTNTVYLEVKEKVMQLTGTFKTTVSKGERSATGDVSLQKAIDPAASKLLADLDQLSLSGNLSFRKPTKEPEKPVTDVAKVPEPVAAEPDQVLTARKLTVTASVPGMRTARPLAVNAPKRKRVPVKALPVLAKATPVIPAPKEPVVAVVKEKKPAPSIPAKPAAPKPAPPPPTVAAAVVKAAPKPAPVIAAGSASDLGSRSIETIQTVYFKSDSLRLTLYDNGEVDGDTVSVILNGKVIMGKKGLSTNAINETIYMTPDLGDSLQMIMYAENLGTIAPNTGLLIVQDGRDRYEIRFSGDLSKNDAIIFKRRKE